MLNFAAKESKMLMSVNADIGKEIESAHVGMPTSAVKGLGFLLLLGRRKSDWLWPIPEFKPAKAGKFKIFRF